MVNGQKYWQKQSLQENLIYLAVWVLLFLAPLLSLYVRTMNDMYLLFDWTEVFLVWRRLLPFLLLFLVHNFLLAPLLIHHNKRIAYASIMVVVIAAFTVYQCSTRPDMQKPMGHRPPPHMERTSPPALPQREGAEDSHGIMNVEKVITPRPSLPLGGSAKGENPSCPPSVPRRGKTEGPGAGLPPPIIGEHDILAVVILILMFGANLGIKGWFRSRDDCKRLAELERENLEQQLEYLRYQINPHFFMNTLNNIHALVDIDPTKAQETIVELSKMMRYVLYEGNKQGVPLSQEFDFIQHYVSLMQLRYTDKVRITLDLPQETSDRQIPPLMLITFIENAFKHGISYQHDSFIEMKAEVKDDKLQFVCRNSKSEKSNEEKGGVGLANVRKRLDLLYDNNYTLHIDDTADIYSVGLVVPLLNSKV